MCTKLNLLTAFSLAVLSGLSAQTNSLMKATNSNAPVKCNKSIVINANPERVWALLTKIEEWPKWQTDIGKAKLNGSLNQNTTFDWKTGGVNIHSTLHTVEPNKYLGWTGKSIGMYAIHNWKLTKSDGKVQVNVTESMEGFLASILKGYLNKNLDKSLQLWLELLKLECEKEAKNN